MMTVELNERAAGRYMDDDQRRLIGPYLSSPAPAGKEWRGFCVLCEEPGKSRTPSASYNFDADQWNCMKTDGHGGGITALIAQLIRDERGNNVVPIGSAPSKSKGKAKVKSAPLPTEGQISTWMEALKANEKMLDYLHHERGLDDEAIQFYRIGWDATRPRGRLTIPIYDADGELLNVRIYDRKPPSALTPKMMPFATGYNTQVYGLNTLAEYDKVVLCEGEWDRIVNEQNGIPTITTTAGAGSFQMEWASAFAGKVVYLCYDEDKAGVDGAIRTANILKGVAAEIYIMTNLKTNKKGGDLTDFWTAGATESHFRSLMDDTPRWDADNIKHVVPTSGKIVKLESSQDPTVLEPIELRVTISGKQTPPYLVPREYKAKCGMDKGPVCAHCDMSRFQGDRDVEVSPDDARLLHFIEASDRTVRVLFGDIVEARCTTHISFDVKSNWSVEELSVQQSIEERIEETSIPMDRKVFNVGTYETRINTGARIVGRQVPDPRNQRGLFYSWHLEPIESNIDKFRMTPSLRKQLKVFQPSGPFDTPLEKCVEIAEDLAANVTHIYGRPWMHVAYDLVWHSAMAFDLDGVDGDKGWLDVLVVGDTRTGKSATAKKLAKHYRAGVVKSCEGATFAGIVGGNKEMPQGKGMMVKWGVIPLNDRRMVVLDELSGIVDKNILADMSSVRSSGIAQITKIADGEATARTRLLWLSNPVNGRTLAESASRGIGAIKALVRNPEDIARFDFAMAVAQGEVPSSVINNPNHGNVPHVYTTELCSALVLWAWSRKRDQIKFDAEAASRLTEVADGLGRLYLPDPPLVQAENVREKIARIAIAIAARTFSTDKTGENIIVEARHIDDAEEFLKMIYSSDSLGYYNESVRIGKERDHASEMRGLCIKFIQSPTNDGLLNSLHVLSQADSFQARDLETFGGGYDHVTAINKLFDWHMLRRLHGLSPSGRDLNGRISFEPELFSIIEELRKDQ